MSPFQRGRRREEGPKGVCWDIMPREEGEDFIGCPLVAISINGWQRLNGAEGMYRGLSLNPEGYKNLLPINFIFSSFPLRKAKLRTRTLSISETGTVNKREGLREEEERERRLSFLPSFLYLLLFLLSRRRRLVFSLKKIFINYSSSFLFPPFFPFAFGETNE